MNNHRYLHTQCTCKDLFDNIWIWAEDFNGLFRFDTLNNQFKFVMRNPYETPFQAEMYNFAVCEGNLIFLFPVRAKGIGMYNMDTNEFTQIDIPERSENIYYNCVKVQEHKIVLFPVVFDKFVYEFDLSSKSIEAINIEQYKQELEGYFCVGSALQGGVLTMVLRDTSKLVEYDVANQKLAVKNISSDETFFLIASGAGKLVALLSKGYKLAEIVTDKEKKSLKPYKVLEYKETESMAYIGLLSCESRFILLPYMAHLPCLMIDERDHVFEIDRSDLIDQSNDTQTYARIEWVNDYIYFFPYRGNHLLIFKPDTQEKKELEFEIDQEEKTAFLDSINEKFIGDIIQEAESGFTLDDWLYLALKS